MSGIEHGRSSDAPRDVRSSDSELELHLLQAMKEEPFSEEERKAASRLVNKLANEAETISRKHAAIANDIDAGPRRFGSYDLIETIGPRSGHGGVWKARHVGLGSQRAVKLLRDDNTGHSALERFKREMVAIGRICHHPNIVQAHDSGEVDGVPYLAMELLEGLSLAQILARHACIGARDACELIRQAAVGLHLAHREGIVHRDVKPGNLMLTTSGKVKVLDLGLALVVTSASTLRRETQEGVFMGTWDYMPPEQSQDPRSVDERADIYSLGCTLYHLLTGKPPFAAPQYTNWSEKMAGHLRDSVVPISNHIDAVPDKLERIIGRMLAKTPAERFSTAAEVALELRPLSDGHDVLALLGDDLRQRNSDAGETSADLYQPDVVRHESQIVATDNLDATLDVLFWDEERSRHNSITEPGTLPVRIGTKLQIEARANRDAYLYLVWITSEGVAQPLYPWSPGDWSKLQSENSITNILLPQAEAVARHGAWTIDSPAGIETLVLMARKSPLTPEAVARIPELLTGFPVGQFPGDVGEDRWYASRSNELPTGGTRLNLQSDVITDPLFHIHSVLRDRLGSYFDLIRAVSFANLGTRTRHNEPDQSS